MIVRAGSGRYAVQGLQSCKTPSYVPVLPWPAWLILLSVRSMNSLWYVLLSGLHLALPRRC